MSLFLCGLSSYITLIMSKGDRLYPVEVINGSLASTHLCQDLTEDPKVESDLSSLLSREEPNPIWRI